MQSEIKCLGENGAAGNHQNNIQEWKVDAKTMSGTKYLSKTDEDTCRRQKADEITVKDARKL